MQMTKGPGIPRDGVVYRAIGVLREVRIERDRLEASGALDDLPTLPDPSVAALGREGSIRLAAWLVAQVEQIDRSGVLDG